MDLLQNWFESIPVVIFMYDSAGQLVLANPGYEELFGVQGKRQKPDHYLDHVTPETSQMARGIFDKIIATGESVTFNIPAISAQGQHLLMFVQASRLYRDGSPHVMGVAFDITDRAQAEQESLRYRRIFRRRSMQLIRNHEQERESISRELHDQMGQSLTAIRANAISISQRSKKNSPDIHELAQAILGSAAQTYDAAHSIIKRLRPGVLYDLGLVHAIEDLLDEWRSYDCGTSFSFVADGDFKKMGREVSLSLYRIVQECITNVIKHSHATAVHICLSRGCDSFEVGEDREIVQLEVQDNGTGIDKVDTDSQRNQLGLVGMQERALGLGGKFNIENLDGGGTRVSVAIPMTELAS